MTKLHLSLIQSIPNMVATYLNSSLWNLKLHQNKSLSSASSVITLSVRHALIILNSHLYLEHHRWFFPWGVPNKTFVFLFSHKWYTPHPYHTHYLIPPNNTRWTEKIMKLLSLKWYHDTMEWYHDIIKWYHYAIKWITVPQNDIMALWNGIMMLYNSITKLRNSMTNL